MKPFPALVLLLALRVPPVSAQGAVAPSSLALTHVSVVDVRAGRVQPDQTVIIRGNRIAALGGAAALRVPQGAQVVDGRGKYLIPGLWDMHVHAFGPGRKETFLPLYVANGVTGVRDLGTALPLRDVVRQRREIAEGTLVGPRIAAVAGPLVDGLQASPADMRLRVASAAEARLVVDSLVRAGADYIKVYPALPREAFFAIAEEAKRLRVPFAGHVPGSVSALEASDAGMRSVEHLAGMFIGDCARGGEAAQRALVTGPGGAGPVPSMVANSRTFVAAYGSCTEREKADLYDKLARNGTWVVPTLVHRLVFEARRAGQRWRPERQRYLAPAVRAQWENPPVLGPPTPENTADGLRMADTKLQAVGEMHRAGIPLLAGTDHVVDTYPGFSLHEELELLVRAGLTPLEALRTATLNPARYLEATDSLGTVERGKAADLVLLDADPLADIRHTQRIAAVVLNGRYFDRKQLDELLAMVEQAAAAMRK